MAGAGGRSKSGPKAPAAAKGGTPGDKDIQGFVNKLDRSAEHGGKGHVPVYAVRAMVRKKFGDHAASDAVFNPMMKRMRSEGKLKLFSLSDHRDFTPAQQDASLPGFGSEPPIAWVRTKAVIY